MKRIGRILQAMALASATAAIAPLLAAVTPQSNVAPEEGWGAAAGELILILSGVVLTIVVGGVFIYILVRAMKEKDQDSAD